MDASDQSVLASLTDGAVVELDDPASGDYAIRVDVDSGSAIGSVHLELTGAKSHSQTENVAPYSLYGDNGANALTGGTLPLGSYDLEATAYSQGNKGGDVLGTLEVSFTVTEPPDPADLAPSNLAAEVADDGVSLTWDAPAEEIDNVTGYRIERAEEEGEFTQLVTNTNSTGTVYADTTAETGKTYHYRVAARRGSDPSAWSPEASVTLPQETPSQTPTGLTPAALENNLLGYSEPAGAGTLEPAEVTIDDVTFRVTTVATWPGFAGLVLMLTAGTSEEDAALADTDFILEAHEYVLTVSATEFSFDDALPSHSDTTAENAEYTGVVTLAWTDGEAALTAGETVVFRLERRDRPEQAQFAHATTPSVLVKNTGQMLDTNTFGIHSTVPEIAQAFTTGSNPTGYTLSSIGINFDAIDVLSTAGSELTATVNATTTESGNTVPGNAWCTLEDPGSFTANVVNTFSTPTGGGACPTLTPETTYFLVLQRANVASGGIVLAATNRATEDSDKADDWSIGNSRHFVDTFEDPGSWGSASTEVHMIEVNGFVLNNPATGAPSIQGVLQTGETLTADALGISDADGLTSATYTYQWIKVDSDDIETDIPGATGSTYTLTSNEEDHGIRLRVGLTDEASHSEEGLTSAVTDEVVASGATRKLIWLADMTVGTGTGVTGYSNIETISISGGTLGATAFTYKSVEYTVTAVQDDAIDFLGFYMEPIPPADANSWILGIDNVEEKFNSVNRIDDTGSNSTAFGFPRQSWTGGEQVRLSLLEAVNAPATSAPSIQGILQQGEMLTADTVGVADPNGVPSDVTYTYQWLRADDATDPGNDISGATGSTYTLAAADVDKRIRLKVTFTDSEGFSESPVSAATPAIVAENGTRRLLWLGTMTVGAHPSSSSGRRGFDSQAGFGSLSPAAFKLGENTHTFTRTTYQDDGILTYIISPNLSGVNIDNWHLTPDTEPIGHNYVKIQSEFLAHYSDRTEIEGQLFSAQAWPRYRDWTVGAQQPIALVEVINQPGSGVVVTGTPQVAKR